MRNKVINNILLFIQKYNSYNNDQIEKIKYGLESIYILITKSFVIVIGAILLGILKELLIFILFYNLIRMTSFGLHATKSWICLISSLIIFLIAPYVCKFIYINIYIKAILGIILILRIYICAPADTYKRPIINQKRRNIYKTISTLISIIYIFSSIFININFISNCLIFSLIVQLIMISPYTYKLFKLPYNNYLGYIEKMA